MSARKILAIAVRFSAATILFVGTGEMPKAKILLDNREPHELFIIKFVDFKAARLFLPLFPSQMRDLPISSPVLSHIPLPQGLVVLQTDVYSEMSSASAFSQCPHIMLSSQTHATFDAQKADEHQSRAFSFRTYVLSHKEKSATRKAARRRHVHIGANKGTRRCPTPFRPLIRSM